MTYTAVLPNGTTVTTIEATPTLKEASVEILPGDIDAEPENGHQAKVEDGSRIKVMVTSLDGDRTNEYTVEIKQCLSGLNGYGLGTVQFIGGSLSELEACARDLSYSAIYHYRDGVWAALFLGAPEFLNQPFRNRFAGGIGAGAVLIGKRVPDLSFHNQRSRDQLTRYPPIESGARPIVQDTTVPGPGEFRATCSRPPNLAAWSAMLRKPCPRVS